MPEWTPEWPETEGYYWFYGYLTRYEKRDGMLALHIVRVWRACMPDRSCTYVCGAQFLYKAEGAEGFWLPLPMPELPKEHVDDHS